MIMFDNLREESTKDFDEQAKYQPAAGTKRSGGKSKRFLGMTSMQRFVIVLLLSLMICAIGVLFLLATQRIVF
jgi:hypothetical protein